MPKVTKEQEDIQGPPTKIWNKVFISMLVANMAMNLGQRISTSIVAKYADYLGATATVVGVVTSMFAVTALIFKVISGPAIDTFNRKYIMMGAILIMGIAFFGFGFSHSVTSLIVFRLVQGAGQAFSATVCLALAADSLPHDKFGAGIGYFSLAQVATQAIGPTIGLILINAVGYSMTFIIGGCIMLGAVIVASRIKLKFKRTKKLKISINNIIAKEAILPAIIMFFLTIPFSVIASFLIIYANKQGIGSSIGLFFTVYAVTLLFTRPFIGKISDKYGIVKVVIPAIFFTAVSYILISYSSTLPMFLLTAVVSAFGYGACQPAIQSLSMKSVPTERRGAASSTNYIGNDLGNLVGPVLAGAVAERAGYSAMWQTMIFPIIIAAIIVVIFRARITGAEEKFLSGSITNPNISEAK